MISKYENVVQKRKNKTRNFSRVMIQFFSAVEIPSKHSSLYDKYQYLTNTDTLILKNNALTFYSIMGYLCIGISKLDCNISLKFIFESNSLRENKNINFK